MTPNLELNNGITMPALGFGVFQTPPEETAASVETALGVGYRPIDTAAVYGNEHEVGDGIRRSDVPRTARSSSGSRRPSPESRFRGALSRRDAGPRRPLGQMPK
jgi:aryl-alcohol dehydrogenase-like predicted oxidoreductase